MEKPVLIIMAAGLGSRFGGGGAKQVTPVDDRGQMIVDYSVYDAVRAGFERVIFVVKPENEASFHEMVGKRMTPHIHVEYAHQTLSRFLPEDFPLPEGRVKPWGTGHAALCAAWELKCPFVVINADDFYGAAAYADAMNFLYAPGDKNGHAMVGYRVRNTMTENGSVARGVCQTDENGMLEAVVERTHIEPRGQDAAYTEDGVTFVRIPGDTIVSLNFWAFRESIIPEMRARFERFLRTELSENPLKKEYFLPSIPNQLLSENAVTVRVLPTHDKWFGMTYHEDLATTRACIAEMVHRGVYPENLWEGK